uniref:PITPNM family member 3 n=1 Tax=Xenopus tropicalis TaxID=8364 RepID=A0A6I8PJD6_XENTR
MAQAPQTGGSRRFSGAQWHLQKIINDSVDSSDDEFFDAREEVVEGKSAILIGMSQWNSNDLVEQIETIGKMEENPGELYRVHGRKHRCPRQSSFEIQEDSEDAMQENSCKTQVLALVLHGGSILDTGGGDINSKLADVNTFSSVFEKVTRAHFPAALGHILIRLVPCPAICSEAFSLVYNLNPYSYDENCLNISEDHIPLAALPLLAISSPQYQDAVAMVINRANQVYNEFLKSPDGASFNGQVCLIGDCVGGILGFDALCYSGKTPGESQNSSRRGSCSSIQDNSTPPEDNSAGLRGTKRLSKSNIDISGVLDNGAPKQPLLRKQSDSSTYDCDTITQHHAFLSSIHSSVLKDDMDFPRTGSSNLCEVIMGRFDFEVSDFFLFGSPLGLVLAMRRTVLPGLDACRAHPACSQVYSFFHSADPSASRLEPLLEKSFHMLPPFNVPRYQKNPLGDGKSYLLVDAIQACSAAFVEQGTPNNTASADTSPLASLSTPTQRKARRSSLVSMSSEMSGSSESLPSAKIANITANWWGSKRIDYALYCPDVLTAFPTVALPHLFHASYWESTDVVAFILRQLMRYESVQIQQKEGIDCMNMSPSSRQEKWLRKRNHVKLRNVTANHRANDVIAVEGGPQVLVGRFMYGPLDMVALTGEKVDVLIMTEPSSGRWVYFETEISNSSGRVSYSVPKDKRLGVGVYPIKMVVRHWQDLGFLIIYITGRPDMQKQRVVSWLSQHNFPQGMIFFSDGLVHDPLRQKTIFLRNLMQECHIKISAAYGSMKDISVYSVLGLSPPQIYIVGRPAKKYQNQCQFVSDGYAAHLASLEFSHHSRPKKNNSRMILRKGSFGLHTQPEFLRKRNHLRRTMSVQQPEPPSTNPKPERAQSQPESDKDHERHLNPLSWVRNASHKFEPSP